MIEEPTPDLTEKDNESINASEILLNGVKMLKDKYELEIKQIKEQNNCLNSKLDKHKISKENLIKKSELDKRIITELSNELKDKNVIMSDFQDERQLLISQVNTLRGKFRVFVKIRPLDLSLKQDSIFKLNSISNNFVTLPNKKSSVIIKTKSSTKFMFDQVFSDQSTQKDVFNSLKSYLDYALYFKKISVFAYGQTGAGKTYTVNGSEKGRR